MVKSLSSANQTNIAATHLEYDVLVEMPNLSSPKKWSSGTRSGYETRLMNISEIRQSVDPSGGVASLSDFTVTIQQETPTQFIQEQDVGNTVVEVYIQFGSDAKIPVIKGRLDRWELQGGLTRLFCIADLGLRDKHIPLERITADNFSGFRIPGRVEGQWVPFTIGDHDRAVVTVADLRSTGSEGQKFIVNSDLAASGHSGVTSANTLWSWFESLSERLEVQNTVNVRDAGYLELPTTSPTGGSDLRDGYTDHVLVYKPRSASTRSGSNAVSDFALPYEAVDDDFSTDSLASEVAPTAASTSPADWEQAKAYLVTRLGDFESSDGIVDNLHLLADMNHEAFNTGAGSADEVSVGIEITEGSEPPNNVTVLSGGDNAFDNINEETDARTSVALSVGSIEQSIGEDRDDDGTKETLFLRSLSDRNYTLTYNEQDTGEGETHRFHVNEMWLRVAYHESVEAQEFLADLEGYDDDGSGTYTGSANALIENPADVIHFLLDQYLGLSGMNTSQFATARDNMGGLSMAGQVLKRQGAQKVLEKIGKEFKLKIFTDFNDDWAASAIQPPTSADKTLRQTSGDFTTGSSEPGAFEGEIKRVTQSPLEELYNQFTIRYDYDRTAETYASEMTLDETTTSSGLGHPSGDAIGAWLTESQSRYNVTRELVVELDWVRGFNNALALAQRLIYFHADRKRIAEFQTSVNTADLEIGDTVEMAHDDLARAADSTIHAGYETDASGTTVQAGFTDPDTSAVIKAGADVEIFGARHIFEIFEVRADLLNNSEPTGLLNYKARQAGIDRAPLVSPV